MRQQNEKEIKNVNNVIKNVIKNLGKIIILDFLNYFLKNSYFLKNKGTKECIYFEKHRIAK